MMDKKQAPPETGDSLSSGGDDGSDDDTKGKEPGRALVGPGSAMGTKSQPTEAQQGVKLEETPEAKKQRLVQQAYIREHIQHAGSKVVPEKGHAQLMDCVRAVKEVLAKEPSLLELTGAVTVCGDLHGNTQCLAKLLSIGGMPWHTKWLFLGNYINRGQWSVELLTMVLAIKRVYPNHFFLLRGNHESDVMSKLYGFRKDFLGGGRKFKESDYKEVTALFDMLPLAATINRKVFCCHGGLSIHLLSANGLDTIRKIKRPTPVPPSGLITDLLWACPKRENGWAMAPNKISNYFGPDIIQEFCDKNGIELIVRGMQLCKEGFIYYPTTKMITIFSSKDAIENMRNDAAIIQFDDRLKYVIKKYNTAEECPISTQDLLTECDDTTVT